MCLVVSTTEEAVHLRVPLVVLLAEGEELGRPPLLKQPHQRRLEGLPISCGHLVNSEAEGHAQQYKRSQQGLIPADTALL